MLGFTKRKLTKKYFEKKKEWEMKRRMFKHEQKRNQRA